MGKIAHFQQDSSECHLMPPNRRKEALADRQGRTDVAQLWFCE
jgi:hypothetical protein